VIIHRLHRFRKIPLGFPGRTSPECYPQITQMPEDSTESQVPFVPSLAAKHNLRNLRNLRMKLRTLNMCNLRNLRNLRMIFLLRSPQHHDESV